MTFVMGLLVALARRILRDELQKLQSSIDNACLVADMREERASEAEIDLVNSLASGKRLEAENAKLMAKIRTLTNTIETVNADNEALAEQLKTVKAENIHLSNDLSVSMVAQNQAYEAKRASEKREEDQRAINLELKLRLKKIRELLG